MSSWILFCYVVLNICSSAVSFGQIHGRSINIWLFQLEELKSKAVPNDPVEMQRREKVKEAMVHAWSSYERYAWGNDELQV